MTAISGATKVLAVFGDPITQSLSPVMHNGWIKDHGLDAVYVALPLRAVCAEHMFRILGEAGFLGANVTAPHKEAAARASGFAGEAANTLRCLASGKVEGFNTDGVGFVDALDESAPAWRERVSTVLLVGAGGAAHGVGHALQAAGKRVVIANRTRPRAEDLAQRLAGARVLAWDDLAVGFEEADLVVNATTLGMGGGAQPTWPVAHCHANALICDTVYRPLETGLLAQSRARGLPTVDGLGMLIHQGARAFDIWFGVQPNTSAARRRLMTVLGETT